MEKSESPYRLGRVDPGGLDFAEVKGQANLRRAVEVAVAGGHNMLMLGPPGSGKSMVAKRIPSIMPSPSMEEYLEILTVYSVGGDATSMGDGFMGRPFRMPHHTISEVGLIGGGTIPGPGEISLAHNGVLFLDELPEFRRSALEVLRQPLEDGEVTISRSAGEGNPSKPIYTHCSDESLSLRVPRGSFQRMPVFDAPNPKIPGPGKRSFDRIDIHCEMRLRFGWMICRSPKKGSPRLRSVPGSRRAGKDKIGDSRIIQSLVMQKCLIV